MYLKSTEHHVGFIPMYLQACPLNSHLSDNDDDGHGWMDMSEFFTPAIKSVVNFARLIPGFSHLSQDDQVTLLKVGSIGYFMFL